MSEDIVHILTQDDLRWLLAPHDPPCVSILLGTHPRPPEAEEDPVRFRNLLAQVTTELRLRGDLTTSELQDFLAPLEALRAPDFWVGQLEGLAVYRAGDGVGVYRLPIPVQEKAVVSTTFYTLPLMPLADTNSHFFVLALSQGDVTLYEGDRFGLAALDIPDLPASLQDAVGPIQITNPPPFYSHQGGRDPMYAGTVGGISDNEPDEVRYFRIVDHVICQRLKGETAPLMLAAPAEEWSLYRQANHYPHLLDSALTGNHDRDTLEILHHLAWPLVAPHFDERQRLLLDQYGSLAGAGRATDSLHHIALAAAEGRILALLIAEGQTLPGTYEPDTGRIAVSAATGGASDQEDVLNAIAQQTLRCNGEVYLIPPAAMPGGALVAAVFRY